jgi:hypothetical protein
VQTSRSGGLQPPFRLVGDCKSPLLEASRRSAFHLDFRAMRTARTFLLSQVNLQS